MEPGFNCSDLCDGNPGFGSQEQQQRTLRELCTITVVRTEVGEHEGSSVEGDLGEGMEKGSGAWQRSGAPQPEATCCPLLGWPPKRAWRSVGGQKARMQP